MTFEQNKKDDFLKTYERYADDIFRYCYYKTSDREKAKDLLQDTFTRSWEYLSAGHEIENIRAFLYRIANNLIIDGFRKKKMSSLEELTEQGFDPAADYSERMINQLDGMMLMKLLPELPEDYREVIIMRLVSELSIKEIAHALKEKENNISVRLHRAIQRFRQIVKEHEKK